jgi:hypothetical protein
MKPYLHHHHQCVLSQHTGLVNDVADGLQLLVCQPFLNCLAAAGGPALVSKHNGGSKAMQRQRRELGSP